MSKIVNEIPENFDVSFLTETESGTEPVIRREDGLIFFPALIRNNGGLYRYFDVPVKYKGQELADYDKCKLQCYAALRAFFYGPVTVQLEQQLKGTFAAHQYAVKLAFPKAEGDIPAGVTRFNAIKAEFWAAIDEVLTATGKTRADLPEQPFNAEAMLAWAVAQGMTEDAIAGYAQTFSAISLNLLHNGRNWNELFL